jgi:hypothetical protein
MQAKKKTTVKVRDLKPRKDPKGGFHRKHGGPTGNK